MEWYKAGRSRVEARMHTRRSIELQLGRNRHSKRFRDCGTGTLGLAATVDPHALAIGRTPKLTRGLLLQCLTRSIVVLVHKSGAKRAGMQPSRVQRRLVVPLRAQPRLVDSSWIAQLDHSLPNTETNKTHTHTHKNTNRVQYCLNMQTSGCVLMIWGAN